MYSLAVSRLVGLVSRRFGATVAAIGVLLLAGCASVPHQDGPDLGKTVFELEGRMAARLQKDSVQAQLAWRHGARGDWVTLTGPLGQTLATLSRTEDETVLRTPDATYQAPDPEELTQQALGWRLPVAGLAWWVRGLPIPDSPATRQDGPDGKPQALDQDGWHITYQQYYDPAAATADQPAQAGLPRKLNLTREDVELRLIVDRWATPPTNTP